MKRRRTTCPIEPGDISGGNDAAYSSVNDIVGTSRIRESLKRYNVANTAATEFKRRRQGDRIRDASIALSASSLENRGIRVLSATRLSSGMKKIFNKPYAAACNSEQRKLSVPQESSDLTGILAEPKSFNHSDTSVVDLTSENYSCRHSTLDVEKRSEGSSAIESKRIFFKRAPQNSVSCKLASQTCCANSVETLSLARSRMKVRQPLRALHNLPRNANFAHRPMLKGCNDESHARKKSAALFPSTAPKSQSISVECDLERHQCCGGTINSSNKCSRTSPSHEISRRSSAKSTAITPIPLYFSVLCPKKDCDNPILTKESDSLRDNRLRNIRFRELSNDELDRFRNFTYGASETKIVAEIARVNIFLRGSDMGRLRGHRWLNDEVINAFCALINARNRAHFATTTGCISSTSIGSTGLDDSVNKERTYQRSMETSHRARAMGQNFEEEERPRTYIFNSFFYTRLVGNGYDYDGVRRWTLRAGIDIMKVDLALMPINLSNYHWILAGIDMKSKSFLYLDSMYNEDTSGVLPTLKRWLHDEILDKHGSEFAQSMEILSWSCIERPRYLPRQKDDGSCGVFTLYMADYLELGRRPDFTQDDVSVLRKRTVLFLADGQLPDT